jgi:hypothetical protein
MKILLIIFVIDTLINWFAGNYIKNDIFNAWSHLLTNTPATVIFTITRIIQIILGLIIIIKLILKI